MNMNGLQPLTTTGQDWANHIARYQDSNALLHVVVRFTEELEEERLREAVNWTLWAQPVLRCRFDEGQQPPVWVPLDAGQTEQWLTVERHEESDYPEKSFIEEETLAEGRQLMVRLLHTKQGDTLVLKLDHACCDGGGAKAYLHLLAWAYSNPKAARERQQADQPPTQERTADRLFAACGYADPLQAYRPAGAKAAPTASVPYQAAEPSGQMRYEHLTFPLEQLVSREKQITVNDQLTAAYMRALIAAEETDGAREAVPAAVQLTVDLRRNLPGDSAPLVCNLSGMEQLAVAVAPDEPLEATTANVHEAVRLLKSGHPGLQSAASLEMLAKLPYAKAKAMLLAAGAGLKAAGKSTPLLSNLGLLATGPLAFGTAVATDAYMVTPVMHAPAFMLGAVTYNGRLTLTAAYDEHERSSAQIRNLLTAIKEQLSGKGNTLLTPLPAE